MEGEDIELFLHRQGSRAEVLVGKDQESLRTALARSAAAKDDGNQDKDKWFVFVGESEDALALRETDDDDGDEGEDRHEPVDLDRSLADLDLRKHRHVHITRCKRIAVEVHFGGKTARRKFSPATTVGVVAEWARRRRKFKLDPASAAEYVLQICSSQTRPRSDEHLGELVDGRTCALCFDLVKEQTPQGDVMPKPDQRLLEADLQSAAFKQGVLKGRWGLAASEAIPEAAEWPKRYFWVAAPPRPKAPDRFYIIVDATGYGAQLLTGTFWDPEKKEVLAFDKRPRGKENSRIAKVFRTDWENGRAFYHPFDRVALNGHANWTSEMPGNVWTTKHTVVDFLEMVAALLNGGDYVGV